MSGENGFALMEEPWKRIEKLERELADMTFFRDSEMRWANQYKQERDDLIQKLSTHIELHVMQLAAIMTASLQNTQGSASHRIDKSNPYWTVAYDDVCRAVDREISAIKERDEAMEWIRKNPPMEVGSFHTCTCNCEECREWRKAAGLEETK
jgi:hypothetical protein